MFKTKGVDNEFSHFPPYKPLSEVFTHADIPACAPWKLCTVYNHKLIYAQTGTEGQSPKHPMLYASELKLHPHLVAHCQELPKLIHMKLQSSW